MKTAIIGLLALSMYSTAQAAGNMKEVNAWDVSPVPQDNQYHYYAWTNTTGADVYVKQFQTWHFGQEVTWGILSDTGGNLCYGGTDDQHWSFAPDYFDVPAGTSLWLYVREAPGQELDTFYAWLWYTTSP